MLERNHVAHYDDNDGMSYTITAIVHPDEISFSVAQFDKDGNQTQSLYTHGFRRWTDES